MRKQNEMILSSCDDLKHSTNVGNVIMVVISMKGAAKKAMSYDQMKDCHVLQWN